MESITYILANTPTFMFVLIRTGSILLMAPVFGAMNVPMQVKLGLTLVLTLLLTPLAPPAAMPEGLVNLATSVGGEILIGASIGLSVRFIFAGIEFAGQVASFQMGLSMASAYDPLSSSQSTIFGKMMSILTILVFLSVNGHLMVLMALQKSFDVIPPYGLALSGGFIDAIVGFSKEMFVLAFKFSAPIVAILIFVNIALGIMSRIVPQINMFAIGFAITILVGFVMLAISLPVFETALTDVFDRMWHGIFDLMRVI